MTAPQGPVKNVPTPPSVFDVRYLFFEVPQEAVDVTALRTEIAGVVQQLGGTNSEISISLIGDGSYTESRLIWSPSYQISQVQVRDVYVLCVASGRARTPHHTTFPTLPDLKRLIGQRDAVTIDTADVPSSSPDDWQKRLAELAHDVLPPNTSGSAVAYGIAAENIGWLVRYQSTQPLWLLACNEKHPATSRALAHIVGRDLIHILIPEVKIDYLYRSWRELRAKHQPTLDALDTHQSLPAAFTADSHGATIASLANYIQAVDLPFAETTTLLANGNGKVIAANINIEEMREVFARFGFRPFVPPSTESIWLMPARYKADSLQADVRFVTERIERARSLLEIARVKATILSANENHIQTGISQIQAARIQRWTLVMAAIATSFTVSGVLSLYKLQTEYLPTYAAPSKAHTMAAISYFLGSQTLWQFTTGVVILGSLVWLLGLLVGAIQYRIEGRIKRGQKES